MAAAIPSGAQTDVTGEVVGPEDTTQIRYGKPVDVELRALELGETYERRNIRTHGTLEPSPGNIGQYFILSDGGTRVLLIGTGEGLSMLSQLLGRELEVTGVVRALKNCAAEPPCPIGHCSKCDNPDLPQLPDPSVELPRVSITVLSAIDMTDTRRKKREDAQRSTLEYLIKNPGSKDGVVVRVVGKFRGHNLYGDLPSKSQKKSADWVIKDDLFAIWVTGKKSKGSGFDLDAGLKRDTNKWLEVVGKPRTVNGVTYIDAQQVLLTTPPRATAEVQPPPPLPERPKVPPVIVFALPLDGESEVATDSRFVIQFSKDMDESTFQGRVVVRYLGATQPGDRPFDAVKLSYDGGRRALTIDPGDVLRPGRRIEILLLPGIADVDGLTLTPRADLPSKVLSPEAVEAVDVLRFAVAS